jgi:hypothetical protein
MNSKQFVLWGAIFLLAGCAWYDGRGLVPGQSTASEVQALMALRRST